MSQHIITINVTLVGDTTPERTAARLAEIADVVEEAIDDRFSPDNGKGSIEAPFRYDRTNTPLVSIVTSAVHGQPRDVHPWTNIADSPSGIASHLAAPQAARTDKGVRTSQIHLRDVGDGYWTRVRLTTVRLNREFVSTLLLDHHKEDGDLSRPITSCAVTTSDAGGAISPYLFEKAHEEAAQLLVRYPEAIAHLLATKGAMAA